MKTFRTLLLLGVVLAATAQVANAQAYDFFDPVGTDDRADCTRLGGWTKDGDTTLPIQVAIYKGAPYPSGTLVTYALADKYRGDLPFADKNHGYSIPTPSAFFTGCPERVYVYGLDVYTDGTRVPGGHNTLLNLTGKTIRCGTPDPSCFPKPDPYEKQ